ncbi:hypothetical protein M407DRAFT_8831 [Tulasnella calospora MUT 4182]|uniref:Uncharacterized protein n=1 Tax=Tulasnella calospora MUT 4182 TaxID=1051891 RepID=A0A0C3LTK6_9AGAM|nr:hypothetical protein M407DRAFT_8831 [Tulasnella calospora MUT 4182]
MSDEMEGPSDLDTALLMLDGYDPVAVANALPEFHHVIADFQSNHALQAQLILTWDANFASQVLATWKPSQSTWTEVVGRAKDALHAVKLTLSALGAAGVRDAIAAAGKVHGGAKQVMLMNALRVSLQPDHLSQPPLNKPGSSDISTPAPHHRFPITPSASEAPSLPHSGGKSAKAKTKSNPLTVSTNKPLASNVGSNPSGAIVPQRIVLGQLVSTDSTKENVHPSTFNDLKYTMVTPISTQPGQGRATDFQKLFAADDAKRPTLVALKTVTVASPQPHMQTKSLSTDTRYHKAGTSSEFRDTASGSDQLASSIHGNKTPSTARLDRKNDKTSQLSIVPKEIDDHKESTRPSLTHAPTLAPISPTDGDYESGMDGVLPIPPREAGRFPNVDERSMGRDSEDEGAAYTDDGSEDDEEDDEGSEGETDSGDELSAVEADEPPIPNEDGEEEYPDGFLDPSLTRATKNIRIFYTKSTGNFWRSQLRVEQQ